MIHEREFTNVLANVTLKGKAVATRLLLRRLRYFAIGSPNDNGVVVFDAQNILLAPSAMFRIFCKLPIPMVKQCII